MTAPIAKYRNGGYLVTLMPDGTKIREQLSDDPPRFAETMDLKITDHCDLACLYCHENSTRRGRHGDIAVILDLLAPLPAGSEIAIGGGDPLSHPDFELLVLTLRDRGIIANVTVNGGHLTGYRKQLEALIVAGAVHGVGVSLNGAVPEWDYEHAILHMIAGVNSPALLDGQPRRKILVLGYKEHGRGVRFHDRHADLIASGISQWRRELAWIAREHHVSFDTLAIQQLEPRRLFRSQDLYDLRFMGEEGTFSMYVDGVAQTFGLASYAAERWSWTNLQAMFAQVRAIGSTSVAILPAPH